MTVTLVLMQFKNDLNDYPICNLEFPLGKIQNNDHQLEDREGEEVEGEGEVEVEGDGDDDDGKKFIEMVIMIHQIVFKN